MFTDCMDATSQYNIVLLLCLKKNTITTNRLSGSLLLAFVSDLNNNHESKEPEDN